MSWYKKAAKKKYVPAQHNLANRYAATGGECVTQNQAKAIFLYRLAAAQNYELSKRELNARLIP